MTDAGPLRLRAADAEDLDIVGAILQDAIVPVQDIGFDPAAGRLIMIVHRFCWDQAPDSCEADEDGPEQLIYARVHCAVEIDDVRTIEQHQWPQTSAKDDPCNGMLDLLAVSLQNNIMTFTFAGGTALRLGVGTWQLRLADYGDPWPTTCLPQHQI